MRTAVTPVRIFPSTRRRLDRLVAKLAVVGWKAIGSDRDAVPGLATVIDEGLMLLEVKLAAVETKR